MKTMQATFVSKFSMKRVKMGKRQYGLYRRSGNERRGWSPMPEPPFVDSNGIVVTRDRRAVLDRRKE